MHELSDGTRRLLDLGLATMPGPGESTCFIDEIDRSLHSALAVRLVALLNAHEERAQLVLTTHDTNLLDAGVFGRDAIWFVDLDAHGAAHLYSLAEFDRGQLDALTGHLEQGYLQGRFGAIPFAGDPVRLRWSTG
jgi:AAA15 family ATPase/GTPase